MIQIKELCDLATAENYESTLYQGYQLLTALHDMGLRQEEVYEPLLEYHIGLDEGFTRDLTGDILDLVVGWCAPQRYLWRAELTGDTEDTGGIYLHLFSPNAAHEPVFFWGVTLDDVLQQLLDFNIVVDWGKQP